MQLARPLSAQIGFCGRDKSDLLPTLTKSQPLVARGHPRYLGNLGNPGNLGNLDIPGKLGNSGNPGYLGNLSLQLLRDILIIWAIRENWVILAI